MYLFSSYQPKEETGSAGEQPVSNKADGDDQKQCETFFTLLLFLLISTLMAKKTHSLCSFNYSFLILNSAN